VRSIVKRWEVRRGRDEMDALNAVWPVLYTCPTGETDIERDDMGTALFPPVFSNRTKMGTDWEEGCAVCDMADKCPGPVEYRPVGCK